MQKQVQEVQTVDVNGQQAPLLVANLNNNIPMAIVSQNVLRFLCRLLPKAKLEEILDDMAGKLQALRMSVGRGATIEQYTELLREELEFHESVNILKEFFIEKERVTTTA